MGVKSFLASVWAFVRRNKYLVTVAVFLVLILFIDQNNLMRRSAQKREIKALQEQAEALRHQIAEDEKMLETLDNDSLMLEHIAREKYGMRRSDEDVFIEE